MTLASKLYLDTTTYLRAKQVSRSRHYSDLKIVNEITFIDKLYGRPVDTKYSWVLLFGAKIIIWCSGRARIKFLAFVLFIN